MKKDIHSSFEIYFLSFQMKENGGKMDQTHIDKAECRNNLSRFTEESLKAALILQDMCLKGDKFMNLCPGPQKASRCILF